VPVGESLITHRHISGTARGGYAQFEKAIDEI